MMMKRLAIWGIFSLGGSSLFMTIVAGMMIAIIVASLSDTSLVSSSISTRLQAPNAGAQEIVLWAKTLQDQISGVRANEYDPANPIIAPAYTYWVQKCGGYACDVVRSGNLQCVQFVMAVWHMAGMGLPVEGNGVDFWTLYDREGWQRIPAAVHIPVQQRGWPAPGDIMVWEGEFYGHVAIVIEVQLPQSGMDGTVTVANANVAGNRWPPERQTEAGNWYSMPLHADKTVSTWPGYQVLGYLRPIKREGGR